MATWDDVRRIALALPDAEESTSYRQPCFKVNGRPFANVSREAGAIATRAPEAEVDLLVDARPDVYFVTPHYVGWECVLVRLDAVDGEELAGRLEDSYEFMRAKPPTRPRRRRSRG